LAELRQFGTNRPPDSWLIVNENAIRESIYDGLRHNPEMRCAFQLLEKLVHIYIVDFFHPAEWSPILEAALIEAQDLRDVPVMTFVISQLAEARYQLGRNKGALAAFEIALDRAQTNDLEQMELAAYIGLIRVQATNLSADFEPDLFEKAIQRTQIIGKSETRAALCQALALAYINRWELAEGLRWARKSFYQWRTMGEDKEAAQTCYLIAVAFRMAQKYKQAIRWLNRGEEYFGFTLYVKQVMLIPHERGVVLYQMNQHESARTWLLESLKVSEDLNASHYIYASQYMLGATQIELDKLDEAERLLNLAKEGWLAYGNNYELIITTIGLSHLSRKREDRMRAEAYLQEAEALITELRSTSQQDNLKRIIHNFRSDDHTT
jgi:tetratricopeptide (TPR) repeat protein